MLGKVAAFGLAATLIAVPAAAVVPIAGLVNTGVTSGGGSVTVGVVQDANWLLNGVQVPWNSITNGSFPQGPWLADDSVSRWVTPAANPAQNFDPTVDGFYNYSIAFDLTGLVPGSASLSGRFAADNEVTAITLNGMQITQGGTGGFTFWTSFSASSGFVSGPNTLQFTVRNFASGGGNPTGLRVEVAGTALAVPEPASWTLLIAGFGLVGALARRRHKSVLA
jgi:hypothetical protein